VGVHEKNELVTIDPATTQVLQRNVVSGVENPHGISLDVAGRLAFVAGEENHRLAVLDLDTKQVLATYPVGEDPDVLAFDPELKLLYVSAESGNVTIFRENGKALVPLGSIFMPHAHTVCVDPRTHLVYFPLENLHGRPVLKIMAPTTSQN
jgi:DNA-binding beta-propeller fold protein YncE